MYGVYDKPFKISKKGVKISLEKLKEGLWLYKRGGEEKILNFSRGNVLINPVEPVNLPKKISSHLLIHLEKPLVLAPKERTTVYLKFPIEIAVILEQDKNYRVIDIFTLTQNKYTLYGSITNGIVCKYWNSPVYFEIPKKLDPLKEGVIEMKIWNIDNDWVDVKDIVINAFDMKIYYSKNLVSMKGRVKVISEDMAEVRITDGPLKEDMKKSVEVFVAKKMLIPLPTTFIMEEGV